MLFLQQEQLSVLRRKVVDAKEAHAAAVKEYSVVLERKEDLVAQLEKTQDLIRTGKMPPPDDNLMDVAQSKILERWDNRKSLKDSIV